MSLIQTIDRIVEYPESDGKPMGETDLHRDWMVRILEVMRYRYRGQRVYVASDLIVYYEEGDPTKCVVPDDFVVKDCDPGRRRTFKIWEEGKAPDAVFEVTSRGSRRDDTTWKPQIYARLGILEYFLYDPTSDYLAPPLQGYRLDQGAYRHIDPKGNGLLECRALGITLALEGSELVMRDLATGKLLLTEAEANAVALARSEAAREAAEAASRAAQAASKQDQIARAAAETHAAELEAELQRLREKLREPPEESNSINSA
jgi:Uma2 family endonuclease